VSKQNLREEKIQPAVLSRLTALAQDAGKTINDFLTDMLNERECTTRLQDELAASVNVTADQWSRELRAWAASHPDTTVLADDSRESIYAGRGE
jgi:hypothetical protein